MAISTDGVAAQTTLDRAVQEANQIKAAGDADARGRCRQRRHRQPGSRNRLIQIAGPQTVDDAGLGSVTSINQVDVALVKDFDKLAAFLRGVVNELCTPSLTVRKLAQTPGSADYAPAPNWAITATPTVAGVAARTRGSCPTPTRRSVRVCGNPTNPNDQAPRTCPTDSTGLASFQWEPDPSTRHVGGHHRGAAARLHAGAPDGHRLALHAEERRRHRGRPRAASSAHPRARLHPRRRSEPDHHLRHLQQLQLPPAIALTKVERPTQVRGDLAPPANTVTSTFTVTNPGNTPLANVTVTDDQCTPVFQSGDTNGDGRLATNARRGSSRAPAI